MKKSTSCVFLCLVLLMGTGINRLSGQTRETLSMDKGWKFRLGSPNDLESWREGLGKVSQTPVLHWWQPANGPMRPDYPELGWRTVDLPHDWAVELPFSPWTGYKNGFKALGASYPDWGVSFPDSSIGWYRKKFTLSPADNNKRVWIEFGGVYRDCQIWINGMPVYRNEEGYVPFAVDLSDFVDYAGVNTLAVRVDATLHEGWWYEGAGIDRHVKIVKTNPVHVPYGGTFITTDELSETTAKLTIKTEVFNASSDVASVTLDSAIKESGNIVAQNTSDAMTLKPMEHGHFVQTIEVPNPKPWSPETPNFYQAVTQVKVNGTETDRIQTAIGIRTERFDPQKGFFLNGKPYVIKGVCDHEDHAGLGYALPEAVIDFRIRALKGMGCNAVRNAHGCATALLDSCDKLGMLVMDEFRSVSSNEQSMDDLKKTVICDRNHPSVFLWSLGNEDQPPTAARMATAKLSLLRELDPSRPSTLAMNNADPTGPNALVDVRGWNYQLQSIVPYHQHQRSDQGTIGTEQTGLHMIRDWYQRDNNSPIPLPETPPGSFSNVPVFWKLLAQNPWMSGAFVWTGFDYRGEPVPESWPMTGSYFGAMDQCGFPKPSYDYWRSIWTDQPTLRFFPNWNWPADWKAPIDVYLFSNCPQVELFVNGVSQGRKSKDLYDFADWKVTYSPGTLSAIGYDKDGKQIIETKVPTAGAPVSLKLEPDRSTLKADGCDASLVKVSIVDKAGNLVTSAKNHITFELAGPGRIIGVGNGSPASSEPDQILNLPDVKWLKAWWVKSLPVMDNIDTAAAMEPSNFDVDGWKLGQPTVGGGWQMLDVFRGSPIDTLKGEDPYATMSVKQTLTDSDLQGAIVTLQLGGVQGKGFVYVNGKKAGEIANSSYSQDVTALVHPGQNMISVVMARNQISLDKSAPVSTAPLEDVALQHFADSIKNSKYEGCLYNGAVLSIKKPDQPWSRNAFGGLAQVIIQTTNQPGNITLTAHSPGLTDASVTLISNPATIPAEVR
jgi:beta-galactosidase